MLIRNVRALALGKGARPRRGTALGELSVVTHGDVIIHEGKIVAVGRDLSVPPKVRVFEADGRVLMPGFVDCHTHACWAGSRLDEWDRRRAGESYQEIQAAGGGIMATVRAVRETPRAELCAMLLERLGAMIREGTTTVEIKSGYGLSAEAELKMLGAIHDAAAAWPGTVVPTALLGHAVDPEEDDFVESTIEETLPAIHEAYPTIAIDAYCEEGAWSVADTVRLLDRARSLGHPVRVHADQFTSLGMVEAAIELGAVSVDHLEASSESDLAHLARSATFGVVLPCCGFHLDGRYANARALVDAGGLLAVATNCNPGSAPCSSMPMALTLAVRHCGLSVREAIAACTVNAASVLGLSDRGAIAPGQRADLLLLRHRDERQLAYEFGGDPVEAVICNGKIV